MRAHEAAQPSTPLPPDGQTPGWHAVVAQPPLVPDYELLCRIGIGAYGDVWLARGTLGAYRASRLFPAARSNTMSRSSASSKGSSGSNRFPSRTKARLKFSTWAGTRRQVTSTT